MSVGPENEPIASDGDPKPRTATEELPATASAEGTRSWDTSTAVLLILGVFAVMVIIGVVIANQTDDEESPDAAEMDGVVTYVYFGGMHSDEPITYAESPPVGGEHADVWQNCGFYGGVISSEQAVHSLEHGAVWITYSPDLPEEQRAQLQDLANGQDYLLVSEFVGLPSPVVATAWNHQLALDSFDEAQLGEFIRLFKLNDESPEPGAPCTGGSGELAA